MKINRKSVQKFPCAGLLRPVFLFLFFIISSCQRDTQYLHMDNENSNDEGKKLNALSWESGMNIQDPQCAPISIDNALALSISPSHSGGDSNSSNSTSLTQVASDASHDMCDHTLVSTSLSHKQSFSLTNKNVGAEQALVAPKELPAYSEDGHRAWFRALTMFIDHSEDKSELQSILNEGQSKGYLTKAIFWDDKECTPMHYAAQEGDLTVVRKLSEAYQVPLGMAVGNYQKIPLHLAASRGRLDVVKYILSKEGSLKSVYDTEGSSVLQYATLGNYGMNNVEVVKYLVEDHSINPEEKSEEFNLLYLAIEASNLDMVGYLLQKCPSLAYATAYGMSPFDYAENIEVSTIAAKIACVVAAAGTSIRNLKDSVLVK